MLRMTRILSVYSYETPGRAAFHKNLILHANNSILTAEYWPNASQCVCGTRWRAYTPGMSAGQEIIAISVGNTRTQLGPL